MSFTSTDPQNHQSENTWFTPKEFSKLYPFDLDPCTVSYRPHDMARFNIEYDKGENGLEIDWQGSVWLNPPYGKELPPFVDKFINHKNGVMLVFARMGSKEIQKLIKGNFYFYFLRKRIHFISKDGVKKTNAGTDSCLVFHRSFYAEIILEKFEGVLMKGFNN